MSASSSHADAQNETLLDLHGLRAWDANARQLLDVDRFLVAPGEILGIVGSSGSGKSLLVRAAIGLPPATVSYERDDWSIVGHSISGEADPQLNDLRGRVVGYVGQDALGGLDPLRTVERELADSHRLHPQATPGTRAHLVSALRRVGLDDAERILSARSERLSGGQRQRVLLASALLTEPALIIADEATTALDTVSQQTVLDTLVAAATTGAAIILVSHDLGLIERYASRVIVMSDGRIVDEGVPRALLASPAHAATQQLVHAAQSPSYRTSEPETTAREVLRITDLTVTHAGESQPALRDISCTLRDGETLGVIGRSGSGKTTFADALLGLIPPEHGSITLLGEPWSPSSERKRRRRRSVVAAISQDPFATFDPRLTVAQLIRAAIRAAAGHESGRQGDETRRLLQSVGLDPAIAAVRPARLSGGQRQRVAIACALAAQPSVLICDEAVTALDAAVRGEVLGVLAELQRSTGLSLVFISHDLTVVGQLAHTIMVIEAGQAVEYGPATQVLTAPSAPETVALLRASEA